MTKLLLLLATLALVATACGNKAHPTVTDTQQGLSGTNCTVTSWHPTEATTWQRATFTVTDASGCAEVQYCVSYYRASLEETGELCSPVWDDGTGYPTYLYTLGIGNQPDVVILDHEVIITGDGTLQERTCLYHDVNGGNLSGCHFGVAV